MNNKKLLADLLEQPGKVDASHVSFLKEMASAYPYAQPIHLLLAKAEASFVPKAALYSQGNVLFHILNMVPIKNEEIAIADNEKSEFTTETEVAVELDEQDVYEEIGELNMDEIEEIPTTSSPDSVQADHHLADLPSDNLFIESVAATDFFAFEQALSTDIVAAPEVPQIETVVPDEPEHHRVSKYDDDQLPYTFLWWLAKTRKEHEQIFQPYAQQKPKPAVAKPQNDANAAFQQQYVEHIFHIQTPFEVADHLAEYPANEVKDAKGAEIIERFLKEDPTIKPPKPEQIDNENKAKKSAEDRYDLVSETLAKIYIEQMLYHKAIDTYKKLSLKYPEKSRYFADLIQSIEKKF